MDDILSRRFKPSTDAVDARVGEETVILHMQKGIYFGLDPVGARIWELLGEETAIAQISAQIAEEFGAALETVEADIKVFLQQLIDSDLVIEA